MVRINVDILLQYQITGPSAEFIFNVQPSNYGHQTVISEKLYINQAVPVLKHVEFNSGNRTLRLRANPGPLIVRSQSMVEINHLLTSSGAIAEIPMGSLPQSTLQFLLPSRYCQSDRFFDIALREFGTLTPGYPRVQAIRDWTQNHLTFTSGASNASTSAVDVLVSRKGVCRDYAHLMIAVCRALNIPARFTTGTDFGADAALGPSDFHAYVEVYIGNRWYLFDPSGTAIPMGMIRLGTGRDAADVPFATIFGQVMSSQPVIKATGIANDDIACQLPHHTQLAISSDPFDQATSSSLTALKSGGVNSTGINLASLKGLTPTMRSQLLQLD